MPLTVAVQMDPIERIRIAGDSTFALLLEAQARGHTLLYYTPDRLNLQGARLFVEAQPLTVRDEQGEHARLGEARDDRACRPRRRAVAPGPAVRPRLYRDHPPARAHPPAHSGGQRPARGARRAGKAVRDGLPRADAADADLARARGDRGVPRRARRGGDEAALRLRRRLGVQDRRTRPEFRLAVRSVLDHLPRAMGDPEVSSRRRGRRQAHHPGRRRGARRGQPRAGRATTSAPTWCAAARRARPN